MSSKELTIIIFCLKVNERILDIIQKEQPELIARAVLELLKDESLPETKAMLELMKDA